MGMKKGAFIKFWTPLVGMCLYGRDMLAYETHTTYKKRLVPFETSLFSRVPCGGDKRDRTADLLNAIQALSQLSYTPEFFIIRWYSLSEYTLFNFGRYKRNNEDLVLSVGGILLTFRAPSWAIPPYSLIITRDVPQRLIIIPHSFPFCNPFLQKNSICFLDKYAESIVYRK